MYVCVLDHPPFLTDKWIGEREGAQNRMSASEEMTRDCRIVSAWQQTGVRDTTYKQAALAPTAFITL